MITAPYFRSCSANNMTSSSTSSSSIEFLQDIVHRNQTNDWISQLSAAVTRPLCPPPPQPLTPSQQLTNATTENYFRRGLSLGRSLSTPEPKNWNESLMTSDDFRSQKVGKSERYKTELCRSFEETGFCKYKEKCQFAHGSHELRNVQRHPKYKTDRCRTYHSTGFCPYGSRCHFVHDEQAMMMNRAPVGYGAAPPPAPQLDHLSTRSSPELMNDLLRSKVNDYEGQAVLPDQMNQLLEALSRAFLAVSSNGCPSHGSSSPSPTLSSFEMTSVLRQDSLASGSVRSSPERLPTPTSVIRDDYGMMTSSSSYSRVSSCSTDYDVCGGGGGGSFQSPVVSPTTPLYPSMESNDAGSSSSAFSNIWARTAPHPFSTLFEV